jgi:tripartite-type tricarboxylate transporter receptor subunit TctC
LLALTPMLASTPAFPQAYPSKPVRIIVPFAPGSTIDLMGRIISGRLQERLGQPVIVDNRAGAGGMIGMDAAAKAAPDGHVLAIGALGPLAINPLLYAKTPFDPVRDFAPVTLLAQGPIVIAVHPSIPARNVRELIALAKSRPGELNYGSPGVGSSPHLAGELFNIAAGTQIVHVPYKGNAEALTDLIGGQVSIVFTGMPPVVPLVQAGKLKLLATTGRERIANMPGVSTVAEAGVPAAEMVVWYGVVVPAATPRDVIARLHGDITQVMALPDVRERFTQQGVDPTTSSPEQFAALIRSELDKWRKVIRAAGIRIE